jgi:DNA-binding GntR family transcriptional regulator
MQAEFCRGADVSKPIENLSYPKTLVERAYDVILDAICDHAIKPGERVTQEELAAKLNVSRQPVMNALARLKAEGFLRDAGRKGLLVAPLDLEFLESLYEFRSAIEPLAVKLAARHVTDDALRKGARLVECGKQALRRGDARTLIQADMDYHLWIYRLARNPFIWDTMRMHWHHIRRAMSEVLRSPAVSAPAWKEHELILQALRDGDSERAARLAESHISEAVKRFRTHAPEKPTEQTTGNGN